MDKEAEDELLLTEKEADKAIHETYADFPTWYRVAKAQLAKVPKHKLDSEAIIRKLLKEIKRLSEQNATSPVDIIAEARAELADLELRKIK